MTFPSVQTSSSGTSASSSSTSHTVTLPTGIAVGDLLLIFAANNNSAPGPTGSATGWAALYTNSTSNQGLVALWRVADGTEGSTVTINWTASGRGTWTAYRISGWDTGSTPVSSGVGFSGTSGPQSPAVTPSWGAQDTLWITALSINSGANASVTTYPTNYSSNQLYVQNTGSNGQHSTSATRNNNTTTETPGAFVLSTSSVGSAVTVGVKPVTTPPANSNMLMMFY